MIHSFGTFFCCVVIIVVYGLSVDSGGLEKEREVMMMMMMKKEGNKTLKTCSFITANIMWGVVCLCVCVCELISNLAIRINLYRVRVEGRGKKEGCGVASLNNRMCGIVTMCLAQ